MFEPTIKCKTCGTENPLTETLARPFIDAERKKIDEETRERAAAFEKREKEIQQRAEQLSELERDLRNQSTDIEKAVQERLSQERAAIKADAIEKAERDFSIQLEQAREQGKIQSAKIVELENAELEYRTKRVALDEEKRQLDLNLARRLDDEREKIRVQVTAEEKAHHQLESEAKDRALSDLNAKLLEAQQTELAVRQERQALEGEKQAFELDVARRLDEERRLIREATQKEDDEQHRFKLAEKDKVIDDMRKQVEEWRRKSDQGSQQLQGEVQELELEAVLRRAFPKDEIEPVAVGRAGSDVLHKVVGPNGLVCGTILWESKRTKGWSDSWLAKNRDDQRAAGAHLGVIVSATLPPHIEGFDRKEGVWVVAFPYALGLGRTLRQLVIETALAKVSGVDRDGKSNRVYAYVTGQEFRQRVGAIVDAYISFRKEIETEKRTHKTRWARQEQNLELLLEGAGRLYGDLQGIVGKSMPEVEGLGDLEIEAAEDQGAVLDQDAQLDHTSALTAAT